MLLSVNIRIICLLRLALQVLKYNFCSWGLRPTFSVASGTLSFMSDGEAQGAEQKEVTCGLEAGV